MKKYLVFISIVALEISSPAYACDELAGTYDCGPDRKPLVVKVQTINGQPEVKAGFTAQGLIDNVDFTFSGIADSTMRTEKWSKLTLNYVASCSDKTFSYVGVATRRSDYVERMFSLASQDDTVMVKMKTTSFHYGSLTGQMYSYIPCKRMN